MYRSGHERAGDPMRTIGQSGKGQSGTGKDISERPEKISDVPALGTQKERLGVLSP